MKKVWAWLKKWVGLILGGLLLILTFGFYVKRKKRQLGRVKDELAVSQATARVQVLRAQRERVAAEVGEKDIAIEEIDRKLKENEQEILDAHEIPEDMTDEEVADALREILG